MKLCNFFFFYLLSINNGFYYKKYMGKNGIEVIIVDNIKWLIEKHVEINLGHSNLSMMTLKYLNHSKK